MSSALLASVALAAGCGDDEPAGGPVGEGGTSVEEVARFGGEEVATFAAQLSPVNDSNVRGEAAFALAAEHLTVEIHASGLQPNHIHRQALHGVKAGGTAECPGEKATRSRLLPRQAKRRFFGRAVLSLEPFPTLRSDRQLDYALTFTIDPDRVGPLEDRVVVLKGATAKAPGEAGTRYVPAWPVACGEIESTDG